MCWKHVEAWNKNLLWNKFCASSWLKTEINILRCTVNKTSKHIVCSITFFVRLWDNVEKYCRTGQATDENIIRRMRIACWLTKDKYRHKLKIRNTYCFFMATADTREHVNVMLYAHCLSLYVCCRKHLFPNVRGQEFYVFFLRCFKNILGLKGVSINRRVRGADGRTAYLYRLSR